MMYSQGCVIAILVDGQVLEESVAGIVAIPFGSQYVIRLRNKNGRTAVAKILIDNENVSEDGFVVRAGSYIDIERPVHKAAKFKFVPATSGEAVEFGKNNKTDDSNGVIRVEWRFEKEKVYKAPVYRNSPGMLHSRGRGPSGQSAGCCDFDPEETKCSSKNLIEGCTVEGTYSSQQFTTVHIDLEDKPPIITQIVLKGFSNHPNVVENKYCRNCRNEIAYKDNFCGRCGKKTK